MHAVLQQINSQRPTGILPVVDPEEIPFSLKEECLLERCIDAVARSLMSRKTDALAVLSLPVDLRMKVFFWLLQRRLLRDDQMTILRQTRQGSPPLPLFFL